MTDPWTVHRTNDGRYALRWRGTPWLGEPRPTKADAQAYVERLKERYPNDSPAVLLRNGQHGRKKGGPWRWTLPDGRTGVIHVERKADARVALLRILDRTARLPDGVEWRVEPSPVSRTGRG